MGRGPGLSGNARMWFSALLVLATFINETSQISKNFVNSSMPELRPTFVVNFDMSTVICQHSSDPSDLHLHEMSILCDGKDDCFTNPAMHDESFPYCERKCNSTCNNRGACLYDGQKPQCYCNSGFSGAMCEVVDKNECLDRPCHLMAHCQNTPGAYECKCFPGFTGDGHQCFDIDECYENTKICPENSRCVNLPGTFYCNCTEGFQQKGESLQAKCVDVNECESALHNCGENQMCENTIGGFTCVAKCSKGYEFVKNECVDINECRLENTCDPRAECTNTPGGYECACEPGMSGDGKNCQPLTDCSQREDICDRHALCLPALKMCYCRSGYAGDGITCHDINECEAMENPCESQGDKRCVNVDGGYICCDNEKEDQRCIQEQGAFCSGGCGLHAYCANATCQCLPGYIGDPQKKCLDVDECESDKMCPGVGQWCVNSLGGFLCCGPDSKEVECQGAHIFKTHDGATAILHTNSSANEQWAQRGETVQTAQGGQIVIGQGVLRANGSIPSISIQSKLPCTSYCPSNSECLSGFCECLKGFGGNPHFGCEDIDECALGTSACPEDSEHWCVNTEGSFTCCNVNSTQTDCQGIEISPNNGLRLTGNNREGETVFAASLNESTHGEVVNEEIRVHNVTQGGHIILVRTKETSNINGENGLELNGHGENLNNGSIQSRTTIGGIDETTALPELTVTLPNIVSTLGGHTETTTSIPINQIPVHKNELKIELDNSGSHVIMKTDIEGSGQGSIEDGDMLKDKNGSDGTEEPAQVETSTEPGHITVRITTAEGDESEKTGLEIVPDQGTSDVSVTDVHVRGPLKEDELKSVLANGTSGTIDKDSSIGSETVETSTGAGALESGGSFKNGSGSIVVLANGTGPLPTELTPNGGLTLSAGNITIPGVPSGADGILSEAGKTNSGPASGPEEHKTGTGDKKFGLGPNGEGGEGPKTDGELGKPKDDDKKLIASGGSFNRTTGGIISTIVGNGSIPTGTILIPGHILVNGTLVPTSPTYANGPSGLEGSGTPGSNKPTGVETTEGSGEGPKLTDNTKTSAIGPDGKPKHGTNGKTPLLVLEPTGPGTITGVDHLVPTPTSSPGAHIGTENQPKITSGGSFNQTSGGLLVTSGGNVTLPNGITLSAGNITIPGSILPKPGKSGEPKSPTDGIEIKTDGSSGVLETGSGGLLNKTETTVIFKPVEPTGQTDVTRAGSNELGLEITGHPSSTTSGEVGLEISFTGSTKIPPTEQPVEESTTVPKTGDRQPNTKVEEGSGENEVTTKKPSTDVHDGTEVESNEVDEGNGNKTTTSKPITDIHEGEGTESENVNEGVGKGSTTVGPASESSTANPAATTTPKGTVVKIISSAEEKPKTETEGGALTKVVTGDHGQDFIKILPTTTTAATTVESAFTTEETTQETGLEIIAEHKTTPAGTFESSTPKTQRSSVTPTESSSDKTTVTGNTETSTKAQESSTKPASSSTTAPGTTPEPDVEGSGESNLKNEAGATTKQSATTQETTAETGIEIIGETTVSGKTVESTTSGKIVESTTSAEEVTISTETGSSGSTFEISSGFVTASTPSGTTEEVTGETGLEIIGKTTVVSTGPTAITESTTQGSTSSGTTVSTTEATETAASSVTPGSTTPQSRREPVTSNTTEVTNSSSSATVTTEQTTTDGPFVSGLEIVGTTTSISTGSTAKVDSTTQGSTSSETTVSVTEATETASSSLTNSTTPESRREPITSSTTEITTNGSSSAISSVTTEPTTTDGTFVSGLEIVGTTSIPTGPTAKIDSTTQRSTNSGTTVSTTETASSSVSPKSSTPENGKEAVTPKVTGIPSEATSSASPIVLTEPTTTDGPFVSGLEIIGRTEPTTAPGVTVTKSNHTIAIDETEGSGEATVDGTTVKPKTATEDFVLSAGKTTTSPNGTATTSEANSIATQTPAKEENENSVTPTIAKTTSGPTTTEHPNPTGSTPNFGKSEATTATGGNKTEETTPTPSGITGSTGTTPISGTTGASDKTNKTLEVTETTTTSINTSSSTGTDSVKNNASTIYSVTADGTGSTTSTSITETTALPEKNNFTSKSSVTTESTTPGATTGTEGSSSTESVESTTVSSNGTTESSNKSTSSSTAAPSKTTSSSTSETPVNGTQPSKTTAVTDKSSVTTSATVNGNEATTAKPVDATSEPSSITTSKPTDESSTKAPETSSKAEKTSTNPSGQTTVASGVTETFNKNTEATTSPATVTAGTSSSTASSVFTSATPTGATGAPSATTPGITIVPVTAGGNIELATSTKAGATTSSQSGIVSSTEPTDSDMTPKTEIDDGKNITKEPLDSAVTKQNRKPTDFATEPPLQVTTLEETSSPLTATLSTKDTFALPSSSTVEPETLAPGNTTKCRSGDECGDDAQCERRTGACRCYPGFEGAPPQKPCQDVDECAEGLHNCHPSSRCHNFVGGYACFCPMGYRKNDKGICEDINECAESRGACCSANGTCVNKEGSYGCECKSGFAGDGYLCLPLEKRTCNESEQKTASCEKNHICMVDGQSKTDCDTCNMGYKMVEGKCIDINECSEAHLNMCDKNANCNNLMGTYGCECKEGFRGDGFMCEDIDECLRSPCHPQAECKNAPGSFNCTCPEGFVGDGIKDCTNPLERSCEDVEKFCGRTNHTACLSVRVFDGSLTSVCECEPNYRLNPDSNECEDIDECGENRHNCDPSSSHCVNQDGGFKCECSEGYEGRGGVCVDVDECERGLAGCHANAMCLNQPGSCGCKCRKGFTGDGIQCNSMTAEPVDNSCTLEWQRLCRLENKTCHIDEEDVPQCGSCIDGHHPLNGSCQPQQGTGNCADPSKNNCDVNAECIDVQPGRHFCSCKVGYIGDGMRCDDIDECSLGGICDPNAACKNLEGSFECSCLPDYLGNGFKCIKEPGPNCHLDTKLCHFDAFCATDGSCKCKEGLEGDGIKNCTNASSSTPVTVKDLTTVTPEITTGPIGPTNPTQSRQNKTGKPTGTNTITTTTQQPANGNTIITTEPPSSNRNLTEDNSLSTTHQPFTDSHLIVTDQQIAHQSTTKHLTENVITTTESNNNTGETNVSTTTEGHNDSNITNSNSTTSPTTSASTKSGKSESTVSTNVEPITESTTKSGKDSETAILTTNTPGSTESLSKSSVSLSVVSTTESTTTITNDSESTTEAPTTSDSTKTSESESTVSANAEPITDTTTKSGNDSDSTTVKPSIPASTKSVTVGSTSSLSVEHTTKSITTITNNSNSTTEAPITSASTKSGRSKNKVSTSVEPTTDTTTKFGKDSDSTTVKPSIPSSTKSVTVGSTSSLSVEHTTESTTTITNDSNLTTEAPITSDSTKTSGSESTVSANAEPITDTTTKSGRDSDSTTLTPSTSGSTKSLSKSSVSLSVVPTTESTTTITNDSKSTTEAPITSDSTKTSGSENTVSTNAEPETDSTTKSGNDSNSTTVKPSIPASTKSVTVGSTSSLSVEHTTESITTITNNSNSTTEAPITSASTKSGGSKNKVSTSVEPTTDTTTKSGKDSDSTTLTPSTSGSTKSLSKSSTVSLSVVPTTESTITTTTNDSNPTTEAPITSASTKSGESESTVSANAEPITDTTTKSVKDSDLTTLTPSTSGSSKSSSESSTVSLSVEHTAESTTTTINNSNSTTEAPITSASTKSGESESTVSANAEPITDTTTKSVKDSDLTTLTPSTSGSSKSSSESSTVSLSVEHTAESTTTTTNDSNPTTEAPITSASTKTSGSENTVLTNAEPITDTTTKSGKKSDLTTMIPITSGSTNTSTKSSTVSLSVEPTTISTTTTINNSNSTTEVPITSASTKTGGSESTVSTNTEPITDTTTKSGNDSDLTTLTPSTSGSSKSSSESSTVSLSVEHTAESTTTTTTNDSNPTTEAPITSASTKSGESESTVSANAEPITDTTTKSVKDSDLTTLTPSTSGSSKSSSESSTVSLSVEHTAESTTTTINDSNSTTEAPITSASTKSGGSKNKVSTSVEPTTDTTTKSGKDSNSTEAPITASIKFVGSGSTVPTSPEPVTDTTTKSANTEDINSSTEVTNTPSTKSASGRSILSPTGNSVLSKTDDIGVTSSVKTTSTSTTQMFTTTNVAENTVSVTRTPAARENLISKSLQTQSTTTESGKNTSKITALPSSLTNFSVTEANITPMHETIIPVTKDALLISTTKLLVLHLTSTTAAITNTNAIFTKNTSTSQTISDLASLGPPSMTPPSFETSSEITSAPEMYTSAPEQFSTSKKEPKEKKSTQGTFDNPTTHDSAQNQTALVTKLTTNPPASSTRIAVLPSTSTIFEDDAPDFIHATRMPVHLITDQGTKFMQAKLQTSSENPSSVFAATALPLFNTTVSNSDTTSNAIENTTSKKQFSASLHKTHSNTKDTGTTKLISSDSATTASGTEDTTERTMQFSTKPNIPSIDHDFHRFIPTKNPSTLSIKTPSDTEVTGTTQTISLDSETTSSGTEATTDTTLKFPTLPNIPSIDRDLHRSIPTKNPSTLSNETNSDTEETGTTKVISSDNETTARGTEDTTERTVKFSTKPNILSIDHDFHRFIPTKNPSTLSNETHSDTEETGTTKVISSDSETTASGTEATTDTTLKFPTKPNIPLIDHDFHRSSPTKNPSTLSNKTPSDTEVTGTTKTISLDSETTSSGTKATTDTTLKFPTLPNIPSIDRDLHRSIPTKNPSTLSNETHSDTEETGTTKVISSDSETTARGTEDTTERTVKFSTKPNIPSIDHDFHRFIPTKNPSTLSNKTPSDTEETGTTKVISSDSETTASGTEDTTERTMQFSTKPNIPLIDHDFHRSVPTKNPSTVSNETHSDTEETGTTKVISSDSETTASGTEATTDTTLKFPTKPNIPLIDHDFHRSSPTKNPSTLSNKTPSDTEVTGTTKVISSDSETTASGTEATTDTTLKFPTKPNIPLIDHDFHRSSPTKNPSTLSNKTPSDTEVTGTTKTISLDSETTSSGTKATTDTTLKFPTLPNIPSIDRDLHRSIPTKNPSTLSNETHSDTEETGTTKIISSDSETTARGTEDTKERTVKFPTLPNIPSIDHDFHRFISTKNPSTLSNETHSDTEETGTTKVISSDSETTASGTEDTTERTMKFSTKPNIPLIDHDFHRTVPTKNPSTLSNETHSDTEETGTTNAISSDSTENGELVISHKEMTIVSLPTSAPRMEDIMGVEIKQQTVQSTTNMVNKQTNPHFDRTSVKPVDEENWTSLKSNKSEVVTTTVPVSGVKNIDSITDSGPFTNGNKNPLTNDGELVISHTNMMVVATPKSTPRMEEVMGLEIMHGTTENTTDASLTSTSSFTAVESSKVPLTNNEVTEFIEATFAPTESNATPHNPMKVTSSVTGTSDFVDFINNTAESATASNIQKDNTTELISSTTTTIVINEATLSNTVSQEITANPVSKDTNVTSSETMLTTVTESASRTMTTPNFKASSKTALEGKTGFLTDKAMESSTQPAVASKDVTLISSKTTQQIEMLTSNDTILETATTSLPNDPVTDIDIAVENSTIRKADIAVDKVITIANNPLVSSISTTVKPTEKNAKPVVTNKDTTPTGSNKTQQITESTSTATVSEVVIKTTIRFENATDSSISPMVSQTTDLPRVTVNDIDVAVEDSTTSETDNAANTISNTANTLVAASTSLSDNPTTSSARPIVTNADTTPTSSKTQQVGKSTSVATMSKVSAGTIAGRKLTTDSSVESRSPGTTGLPKGPVTDIDIAVEGNTTSKLDIAAVTVSTIENTLIASSTDKPTESSTEPVVTFADTKSTSLKTSQEVTTSASAATMPEINASTTVGLKTATDSSVESPSPVTNNLPKDTVTDIDIAVEKSTTSKFDIAAVTVSTIANTLIASSTDKPTKSSTEPVVTFADTKPTSLKTSQEVTTSASVATMPEISARTTVGLETATDGAVTVSTIANTLIASSTDKPTENSTEPVVTFADTKPTSLKTSQEVTTSASAATMPEIDVQTTSILKTATDSSISPMVSGTTAMTKDSVTDIAIADEENTTSKVDIAANTASTIANTSIASSIFSTEKQTESSLNTSQEVTTSASAATMPEISAKTTVRFETATDSSILPMFSKETDLPESNSINLKTSQTTVSTSFVSKVGFQTTTTLKTSTDSSFGSMVSKTPGIPEKSLTDIGTPIDQNTIQEINNAADESTSTVSSSTTLHTDETTESSEKPSFTSADLSSISSELAEEFTKLTSSANVIEVEESTTIGVEPVTSNSVKPLLSGTTSTTNSPVTDSKTTFTAVVNPKTASETSSQQNRINEEEKPIPEADIIVSTLKPATQQRAMFSRMSTVPTSTPTEITQGKNFSTTKTGTTVSTVSLQTTTTEVQNKQELSTLFHQAPNSSEVTSVTSITPKSDKENTEGTQQETSVTVSLNSSLPTLKIILGRTSTKVGSTTNKPLNRLPSTLTEISSTERTTTTDQPINSQRVTTNSDITFGAATKLAQTTTNGLNDKVTKSDVVSTTTELAEKTTVNFVKSSSKSSTHNVMVPNKKTTTSTKQDSSIFPSERAVTGTVTEFEESTQASFRPQPTSESSKLDNILVITNKHDDLRDLTAKPEIKEKQSTTLPIDRTTSMNVLQNPETDNIHNRMTIAHQQITTSEPGSFPKEPENREIMWPDIIDMENPSEPGPPSAIPNPDKVDVFIDGKAVKPETPFDEGATSQKQLVPKVTTDIIAGKPVKTGKPDFEIPDEEDIHSESFPRDSRTDSHSKIPTTVLSPTPAPINPTPPPQTGRTFFRPFPLDTNFTRTTHAPVRMRTTPARTNQHHRTRNPRVFGPGPRTKHRTPSPRIHWRTPTTTTTIAHAPAKPDPSDYEDPYFAAGNVETTAKPTTTAPEDDGIEVNNGIKPEKDTGKAGRCSEDDRSACHEFALCEVRSGLCRCKNGFEGDGFTSCNRVQTIDCVTNSSVCHQNAICDRHSRHCACSMGYIGDGILCSPDPQDCVIRKDLCSPDALCSGRRCRCREGYTGDGVKCVSIHQRSANCSECDINAHCDHGVCTCNVGYFGNGLCCVPDPRDCVLSPGVCHPEAHCNEKQRKCECSKGYLGDGISCFPQLSCRTDPSVCHKDAICLPSGQCICRHGYEGNGHHCTTIQRNPIAYRQSATANDAPVSQCANSCDQETQLCIEGACDCKHGFEEKDGKCVDIDECLAKPCHHLAFCHNQPGAYNCICPEGYVGDGKSCVQQINIGDLGVICEHDGMTLILSNSTEMFEGRMFVRGQAENPHCSKSFSSLQQQPKPYTFKVPFEHCNVRLEKDDTFATTVIVQKHPMFITTQAEAYDLKCAFPTGTKEVNSHVNVSELATISTLSDQADGPLCQLTVVDEKQENVNSATVGQFLRLRLEVSPNNTYSILPRNCFAINIETGDRYSLTDRAGCTIDEELFPEWTRITPGMTEATFRTFKWPDSSMIRFQCDCNACVGPCPNVDCRARRESAAKRFRFRRARHAANETAEAVAEMNFVDEEEKKLENKVVDPKRIAFSTLVTVHEDEEEKRAQNEVERWTHGFSTEPEMQPSIAKTESVCIRTTAIVASALLVLLCLGFLATTWIGRLRKTKEVPVTNEPISVISY